MESKVETQLSNATIKNDLPNEKIVEKINKAMGLAKKKINHNKSKLPFYLLVFFLLVFILVMIIIRR